MKIKQLIAILTLLVLSGCNNGEPGPAGKIIDKGTDNFFGTTRYYLIIKPDDGPKWTYYVDRDTYENFEVGNNLYWKGPRYQEWFK